jgi:glycosyltransferase involved in cell wall biosynthesis
MPIITTDNVGCREVATDGYNGYICVSKDSQSLAAQMEKMLSKTYDELRQMGVNGREKVTAEFHEKLVLQYYEDLIAASL